MSNIAELAMLVNDDFNKPLNKQIFDEFILVASDDVVQVLAQNILITSINFTTIAEFIPERTGVLRLKLNMRGLSSLNYATIRCIDDSEIVLTTIIPLEKNKDFVSDFNVISNKKYYIQVATDPTSRNDRIESLKLCGTVRFGKVVK